MSGQLHQSVGRYLGWQILWLTDGYPSEVVVKLQQCASKYTQFLLSENALCLWLKHERLLSTRLPVGETPAVGVMETVYFEVLCIVYQIKDTLHTTKYIRIVVTTKAISSFYMHHVTGPGLSRDRMYIYTYDRTPEKRQTDACFLRF